MTAVTKRFIAGAVCPRCGQMDRLLVYTIEATTYRECVNCDYVEKQIDESEPSELETRVNQEKEFTPDKKADADAEISTIKFYPSPSKNKN